MRVYAYRHGDFLGFGGVGGLGGRKVQEQEREHYFPGAPSGTRKRANIFIFERVRGWVGVGEHAYNRGT